jgi:hypothetical protein
VVSQSGYIMFHCFHDSKSYSLQGLYARLIPLAKMKDEIYLASGAVQRPVVRYKPLPPNGLSDTIRRVYTDVIGRIEHNWLTFPGQPVMYTASYGAVRLGVHQQTVKEALITLQTMGVLVKVGQEKSGQYKANLWLTSLEAGNSQGHAA